MHRASKLVQAELRAQNRARGKIISSPARPVIGCRAAEPKDPVNQARCAEFHARWNNQKEPLLQIWRAR